MKVSIVTAVLNGAASIRSTIDSVAEQDHADLEHIVVDGGSTDDTVKIATERGGRISRIVPGPDRGVYDAFNKGLDVCTGDVVAYLNCGDRYSSKAIVSGVVAQMTRDASDAAFGNLVIVDPLGRVVRRYSSRRFSPRWMAYGFMPAHPTLFLRRSIYDAIGAYSTEFRIAGDYELCLRAFVKRATRYSYVKQDLVYMINDGISNRGWRSKWTITREMLLACRMNDVPTNLAKLLVRIPLKSLELR